MAIQVITQPVIAVLWDFDQTLIPGYQTDLLFKECDVDSGSFWAEVHALAAHYRLKNIEVSEDTLYLNHLLTYVAEGLIKPPLTNSLLRQLGSRQTFYPGMPEFLGKAVASIESNEAYKFHGIVVEHYVVSTGLRQVILGTPLS